MLQQKLMTQYHTNPTYNKTFLYFRRILLLTVQKTCFPYKFQPSRICVIQ